MFVHQLKESDTLGGAPVLSLVISQYEHFGGDRHQETHTIIFSSWPGGVVTRGVYSHLNVFGW